MNLCPHCGVRSISNRDKLKSTRFVPAKCRQCDGESYVAPWWRWVGALGAELGLLGALLAVLYLGWWGLFLSVLCFAGLSAVVSFVPKLIPLHEQSVQSFTWPLARALIASTAVVVTLVAIFIWS
jgi:hypothetical protein